MSTTSPNLPLPVGISEGQAFLSQHLLRYRSGLTGNGLGGPINFASEIPNRSPRNVWNDVPDSYAELGMRRYRCIYFFNSHYTLAIPNIVIYVKENSKNPKSKIAFAWGTSGINGTEQVIADEFTDPVGVKFNSAQARSEASFLLAPLKPRNWVAFWLREILDFDAGNTEFNYYALRVETSDPIAVPQTPDFSLAFVGNMGCNDSNFGKIMTKISARNPSAIFTLGNNSYLNTGDCWLAKVAPVKNRIWMAFGSHDWYKQEFWDKLDDASYPRIPEWWHWPTSEMKKPCGDAQYNRENSIRVIKEDPIDPTNKFEVPRWRIEVFDPLIPTNVIETFYDFKDEENVNTFAYYLDTCQITAGEIDVANFNVQLQNQYRNHFGIPNFDGYRSILANNIHILILNTNAVTRGHTPESPQYQFAEDQLRKALENAFIEYRIVIGYRPGYVAPNTSNLSSGYSGPMAAFNKLYKPLFERYKVNLYINGNVQNYQRTGILKYDEANWYEPTEQNPTLGPQYKVKGKELFNGGIIYLTVGTGGAKLQNNQNVPTWIKKSITNKYGYLLMTSESSGMVLRFKFYDIDDKLLDLFSLGIEPPVYDFSNDVIDTNPFSIRQIYTKKVGGNEWSSVLWNNAHPRTVITDTEIAQTWNDPDDPFLCMPAEGNGSFSIDGEGTLTTGGTSPRLGVMKDFQNSEATVYFKMGLVDPGQFDLRPKTDHFCTSTRNFDGYLGLVDLALKEIKIQKEKIHPNYSDSLTTKTEFDIFDWIGLKVIVYQIPTTTPVVVEVWLDLAEGRNGGDWKKIAEREDNGDWLGVGGGAPPFTGFCEGCGIKITGAAGSEGVYQMKWWHVREINPPPPPPPPPPPAEPGPGPGGNPLPPTDPGNAPGNPPGNPGGPGAGNLFEDGVRMFYHKTGTPIEEFRFSSSTDGRSQFVADLPHCFVNIEVTGYLFIDDVDNMGEEVSIKLRGGPHTDDDNDWGSCYIIGIGYDGSVNSQYEEPHPDNHPMDFDEVTDDPLDGSAVGKWFGIKAIVYEDGNHDHIECWIDPGGLEGGNTPANEWVKFWQTDSNQFTGQCNGDGDNERAYFRMDDVSGNERDAVELKYGTAREIDPSKPG